MLLLNERLEVQASNAAFARVDGLHPPQPGQHLHELHGAEWDAPAIAHMIEQARAMPDATASAEIRDAHGRRMRINARVLRQPGTPSSILLAIDCALVEYTQFSFADMAAQLATERARLDSLLDNAPIGLAFFDREHRYVKINDFLANMNGLPATEHLQRSIEEIFAEQASFIARPIDQVFATRKPVLNLELQGETPATPGMQRSWLTSFYPVLEPGSDTIHYVGAIVTEITDRKRDEDLLRTSAERFALSQRAGGIGTFEWLVQENRIIWTPELEQLYGLQPGGFEGKYENWAQRVHPDDRAAAEANLAEAVAGGPPYNIEFRICRPDGIERWMLAKGDVMFNAQGVAERVIGVNIDITERHEVANTLAQRRQQLEMALDAAHMGAWQWDFTSHALIFTSGCKLHFGFSPNDEPTFEQFIERVDVTERAQFQHALQHTISETTPYDGEVQVRWPDGSLHYIRISCQPLRSSEGPPSGLVGVTLDNTETRELLQREQTALAETQQALRMRDEFLSVASHELKTPLTSMLGNAQLLQRRLTRENANVSPANTKALHVLISQARRLERMINDLLDITRISNGRLNIDAQRFDIAKLARQVVEEVQPTLYLSHVVIADIRATPLMIMGDPLRLEQVLQNLVQNAIKYSPNGGRIEVRVEELGDQARISVSDQGIGVPDAAQPLLFSQFYRASNVRQQQISGMGIGLFVVKEIISMHHGTVSVESREGQGSTFMIDLPLSPALAEPA